MPRYLSAAERARPRYEVAVMPATPNRIPTLSHPLLLPAGLTFALAASPCSTPILATLLAWVSTTRDPVTGVHRRAGTGLPVCSRGHAAARWAHHVPCGPANMHAWRVCRWWW